MQPPPRKSAFRPALSAALASVPDGLIERALQLHALDRQLRQSLPEPLASHVRLGNLRDDRLVFLADGPVWSARLRLYATNLLDAARAAGIPASDMTVKVATMLPVPPDEAPPSPLSPAARESLRAAAATVQDEELRACLLQLASMA